MMTEAQKSNGSGDCVEVAAVGGELDVLVRRGGDEFGSVSKTDERASGEDFGLGSELELDFLAQTILLLLLQASTSSSIGRKLSEGEVCDHLDELLLRDRGCVEEETGAGLKLLAAQVGAEEGSELRVEAAPLARGMSLSLNPFSCVYRLPLGVHPSVGYSAHSHLCVRAGNVCYR